MQIHTILCNCNLHTNQLLMLPESKESLTRAYHNKLLLIVATPTVQTLIELSRRKTAQMQKNRYQFQLYCLKNKEKP